MEFVATRFGASLGGCPDGVPATPGGKTKQGRNGKSAEQGEAGVMVTLAGRHGGSVERDIGAKNVNLRASEEAVDLKVSLSLFDFSYQRSLSHHSRFFSVLLFHRTFLRTTGQACLRCSASKQR